MDSPSFTSDCIALDTKITKLLSNLASFVRRVREARSDLDAISRELHSLQTGVDFLKDDAALFPPELAEQGPAIVERCSYVVDQLGEYVLTLDKLGLSKLEKRTQWLGTGRLEAANFRSALEAYRATIGLALDLVQATTIRDPTTDTEPDERADREVMTDISKILIQMDQLRAQLPEEFEKSPSYFSPDEYMCYLQRYAEAALSRREARYETEPRVKGPEWRPEPGPFLGGKQMFGAYLGDGPDCAIDPDAESDLSVPAEQSMTCAGGDLWPIDETVEPSIHIPSRPPTPPPKDAKRLQLLEMNRLKVAQPPAESKPESITNPYENAMDNKPDDRISPPPITTNRGRGLRRFLSFRRSYSEARSPTHSTNSSESTSSDARPMTPITPMTQASLARRSSVRLSISLQKLPLWRTERPEEVGELVSKAVFGMPLQKSLQV
ncbi:hypothetical protein F4861DRAFT_549899 [Xylaria intraflava]|nr:hypothetical protein F4861DRAFT_549899 [Xylaria intraflava]